MLFKFLMVPTNGSAFCQAISRSGLMVSTNGGAFCQAISRSGFDPYPLFAAQGKLTGKKPSIK